MPPLDDFSVQTLNEIISAGVSSKLIYEGSICERFPCWNDGICVESNRTLSGYICFCTQFFEGHHCDQKTADNCTSLFCPPGSFCSPRTSSCLPFDQYGLFNACDFNPCLNAGICLLVDERPQCVCPPTHRGLLCESPVVGRIEIPIEWNALQFLFLWPRKPRYSKWNGDAAGELELSWDDEEEGEDLIGGQQLYRPRTSNTRAAATATSKNCFEMKSKPLRISSTTDTFVTYDSPTTSRRRPPSVRRIRSTRRAARPTGRTTASTTFDARRPTAHFCPLSSLRVSTDHQRFR
ncbi:EGF-like domain-containing protein [Aphelenchoides fujianensis]|nr:EGF-like domain-containing protein [Aphelenchoides fujianensis]